MASAIAPRHPDHDQAARLERVLAPADGRRRPPRGLRETLIAVKDSVKADNVTLVAAGVAFFALLALAPTAVALVSLYGIAGDSAALVQQVDRWLQAAPADARSIISDQLQAVRSSPSSGLGLGFAAGLLAAVWSVSSGMQKVMLAGNVIFERTERRGFVALKLRALALSAGAMVFIVLAVVGLAAAPRIAAEVAGSGAVVTLVSTLRWPVLGLCFVVGLALLYRYGPDRDGGSLKWITIGAAVATGLWLAMSAAFSFYVSNFGSYNETFGSLGAVVVLMLWLYLTAFVALVGAEIDAVQEGILPPDARGDGHHPRR